MNACIAMLLWPLSIGESIPERPTKPDQMGKLHASKFKQSAVFQSYTNHGHFHPSTTKAEDTQGEALTLSIWASVAPRQWPTITLEKRWNPHISNALKTWIHCADAQVRSAHHLLVSFHLKMNNSSVLFLRNTESREYASICIHYHTAGQTAASFLLRHRLPTVWAPYIRQHVQGTVH